MGATPWLHSRTKRGFDVAVATVGLVLVSPLLVLTALLVRLRLGSPPDPHALEPRQEQWEDFVALEFSGFAQSILLGSLDEPS